MKRFFERIRQKAIDANQPPVLIVALGDSVTQGAMELGRMDPEAVYHPQFQRHLEGFYPITTFSTINAGVGGDSAKKALDRLPRDVVPHQPDLVLIAFGLNDSGGGKEGVAEFESTISQMVSEVRAKTEADLILLTPPFMATRQTPRIHAQHASFADSIIQRQIDGTLDLYAEAIRAVAQAKQVALADVHREWIRLSKTRVDTDSWLINGLNHPDARGHGLAATLLFHTLLTRQP